MTQPPQTYSSAHLRRQRDAHARSDGYGRHRHVYLHSALRELARALREPDATQGPSWLDYGCGKGVLIEEVRPLALFGRIGGYDPAVPAFQQRPDGPFDLVTCLDVLDVTEERFRADLVLDVAAHARRAALFNCITRHKPGSTLPSRPAFFWTHAVMQHMKVLDTLVAFSGMDGFERILVLAAPKGTDSALRLPRA